ncbi:MAG TPA: hypothetical protein PK079_23795 [Leptospiraceae bacterium]|nr:hypothetical protein [Leptospiraceae bacterium]HMW07250.1 hypothetical protein [Leptospiraceae bacterium]HMX35422.1 hypothetical protein [Leptospiraceae bacterium]HMY32600.1 hypothetical protein [Leptospiraceae bacterium]HMZ63773.1 hypothetical protein [Leptospiraceae bacterium]
MDTYKPISCEFHDDLEAYSVLKKKLEIVYESESGEVLTEFGKIVDLYTRDKAEFMLLDSGKEIRLDQLIRVDNPIG